MIADFKLQIHTDWSKSRGTPDPNLPGHTDWHVAMPTRTQVPGCGSLQSMF